MNGIAAVQARMAAIQARYTAAPGTVADAATTGTTAGGSDFADVLAQALGTATGGSPSTGSLLGGEADPALAATGLTATRLAGLLARSGASGLTATSPGAAAWRSGPGRSAVGAVGGVGAADPSTGLVPAERKPVGGYGRLEPPPELARFGNGRIPAEALAPLGIGNHRLYAPAANAFVRMRADAAAAGVEIGITDSYRDYDTQVSLAKKKGLYSQGGLAATPGTSNHGWGLATDLDLDAPALQWMRENASRYGFVEDTPREPWHWGYRPAGGAAAVAATGAPSA